MGICVGGGGVKLPLWSQSTLYNHFEELLLTSLPSPPLPASLPPGLPPSFPSCLPSSLPSFPPFLSPLPPYWGSVDGAEPIKVDFKMPVISHSHEHTRDQVTPGRAPHGCRGTCRVGDGSPRQTQARPGSRSYWRAMPLTRRGQPNQAPPSAAPSRW